MKPDSDEDIECKSEEGITVGLIDTIITASHALKGRNLNHQCVIEALNDLRQDVELRKLFAGALGFTYDKLERGYEIDALETAMLPYQGNKKTNNRRGLGRCSR